MPFSLFLVRIDFIQRRQLYITIFNQIIKFLIGGGLGAFIYYGLYYSLTKHYEIFYIFSAITAAIPSILFGFLIKKYWVFENKKNNRIKRELFQYLVLTISIFLFNIVLLWILVSHLEFHFLDSQLVLSALLTIFSFIITRKIFSNRATSL